jgi:hypothetical protein
VRRFRSPILLLALLAAIAVSPALADSTDQFHYTANGNTFTWQLPSSPTIEPGDAVPGMSFLIPGVTFTKNGATAVGSLDFFNGSPLVGGGFNRATSSAILIDAFGPQVYKGSETAPTFVPGTYAFTDFASPTAATPIKAIAIDSSGTLVISPVGVAEPSIAILLAAGSFALALGLLPKKLAN